jgi:hypothetical protein
MVPRRDPTRLVGDRSTMERELHFTLRNLQPHRSPRHRLNRKPDDSSMGTRDHGRTGHHMGPERRQPARVPESDRHWVHDAVPYDVRVYVPWDDD